MYPLVPVPKPTWTTMTLIVFKRLPVAMRTQNALPVERWWQTCLEMNRHLACWTRFAARNVGAPHHDDYWKQVSAVIQRIKDAADADHAILFRNNSTTVKTITATIRRESLQIQDEVSSRSYFRRGGDFHIDLFFDPYQLKVDKNQLFVGNCPLSSLKMDIVWLFIPLNVNYHHILHFVWTISWPIPFLHANV